MRRLLLPHLILGVLFFSAACSTTRSIRIESEPSGANVLIADKEIGTTPFELTEDKFQEEFRESFLRVKINKNEFEEQILIVPTVGIQNFKVDLRPLDQKYFESVLLKHFQRPQNELVRELLQIQGLLFSKKNAEAEKRLQDFNKSFPNIAASYVLQANLAMINGNEDQARRFLQRALSLDPQDAVVKRMLENFNTRTRQ